MTEKRRVSRRALLRKGVAVVGTAGLSIGLSDPAAAATTLSWGPTDLNNAASGSGVVHESTSNTDHDNASNLKQGYAIASPYLSGDLVGYYPLQEDSGSTAYDFSGNNNDGTINGATVNQTGLLGTTSYGFDGTDDDVTTGTPIISGSGGSSFTVTGWAWPRDLSSNRVLASEWGSTLVWILNNNSNQWQFIVKQTDDSSQTASWSDTTTDTWVHLAGVADSDAGDVKIYADGTEQGSAAWDGTFNGSGENFVVGDRADSGEEMDGYISDVRLYNRALSSSEVQTLYDVVDTSGELVTAAKVK